MARECVALKGTRDGIVLWLDPQAEFNEILQHLKEKFARSRHFWQGVTVVLKQSERKWSSEEKEQLAKIIGEFGMALKEEVGGTNPSKGQVRTGDVSRDSRDNAIIVRRTVRSGQRIHHDGSVVILGDVNPGAEVIATGDIIVLGALRGVAHAGARGEENAVVMAFRLQPTQLRIAHFISRSPDEAGPEPHGPEIARVRNNFITIQSYNF